MSPGQTMLFLLIGIAVIIAGCTQPAAQPAQVPATTVPVQQQNTPQAPLVTMTNPVAPIPFASTKGINLAYELELNGLDQAAEVPEKIEVLDAETGAVIYTPDRAVFKKTWQPASNPLPTAEERMNGTLKLSVPRISIWFKVQPDAVPDTLTHRLTLNRSAPGQPPRVITGGEVTVRKDLKPVVISSPMKGAGWVTMETTLPTTHHFLMPVTINNITTVDQRYAQDWFYIDPVSGNAAHDNATLARNFYGYGKELLAVAEGTVVEAKDGVPENEIIYQKIPFAFETGTGNTVVIDIGNGKYAGYCHMVPGSIRVKKGDRVREGDVIGLLGNTGQSDVPHLHFEVVTGKPSIIGGEGYPYVFRNYHQMADPISEEEMQAGDANPKYQGHNAWIYFGDYVHFFKEPQPRTEMLQENWEVVSFP
ncbi:MAG: M23 family metallopeptidase [Methanomicrobiales archaeon]|nr:M23 family metallopeptidase [Methanomicrobiales archaeon]